MFNWAEYQLVGEFLSRGPSGVPQEAAYRSAVSRMYYASFHEAKEYAEKQGYASPVERSHVALIEWYKEQYQKTSNEIMREIAIDLRALKRKRVHCDYHKAPPIIKSDVIDAKYTSNVVISNIRSLL